MDGHTLSSDDRALPN